MPQPVSLRASVSMSPTPPVVGHLVGDQHEVIADWPEYVSLNVLVEFQLDDGTRVSTPGAKWTRGGPVGLSRQELEAEIRSLVFAHPRYEPWDPRAESPLIVEELGDHRIDATVEDLAALPFAIDLSDAVEAERAAQSNAR